MVHLSVLKIIKGQTLFLHLIWTSSCPSLVLYVKVKHCKSYSVKLSVKADIFCGTYAQVPANQTEDRQNFAREKKRKKK